MVINLMGFFISFIIFNPSVWFGLVRFGLVCLNLTLTITVVVRFLTFRNFFSFFLNLLPAIYWKGIKLKLKKWQMTLNIWKRFFFPSFLFSSSSVVWFKKLTTKKKWNDFLQLSDPASLFICSSFYFFKT